MKYLMLYNPVSGRGRAKKHAKHIQKYFNKRNLSIDFYESQAPHDLEKKAHQASDAYDVFLVAGGDGTVNEVINGIMKSEKRPIIGVLPFGTANDFAGILKISRYYRKALNLFMKETPVLMDVNMINDRYFMYTIASGVLTRISYDISRRKLKKYGYLAYVFEGAKDLLTDYKMPIEISYDHKTLKGDYMMVLGLCSTRVGGFRLKYFSKPKLNDGLFELMLFEHVKHFRTFKILSYFLKRGRKLKENQQIVGSEFDIKTNASVVWNADGELSSKGNIKVKVFKEQIQVYAHPKIKKKFF